MNKPQKSVIIKKEKLVKTTSGKPLAEYTEDELHAIARKMRHDIMTQPTNHPVITFIELEE